ncbi:VWA domain-containing protein [Maritimibacter sp. DP1N21-5]|uniref:VWA domain-containing protein n=1 Tax=Maritimibacter sp. DP1N21-5 TaxID=2836867 RepID=UPI001C461137|nr:VWA domain-containing protein [Maritimibacter sp. DP1N21-5]MBV7410056.1 VWA domain-containing protein [Maritimibacter sp. DP1N21-5]
MLRILLTALFTLSAVVTAQAQEATERPQAILVLDASGSMWGQIDGVNKIVIARDVVTNLLGTLPEDQALGLVAYGHRTKGDCGDIELLAEPGADRAAIADAVNALNPKGKTPLSAAVVQAAEALKYSEEAATVILVSDGIETCDFDPCEVGRQLETTGVNFTAHVIGFDVADAETRAQLQCLADETGGSFRTASDAGELAQALTEVATAPVPEPEPEAITVTFRAVDGPGGVVMNRDIVWTITAGDATLAEGSDDASPVLEIAPGMEGLATVTRLLDEEVVEARFTVGTASQVVEVILPKYAPPATVEAPASAPAGSMVPVTFTGPRGDGDYIASAEIGSEDGHYVEYSYVADAEGDTVEVRMPPTPGPAEIRYVLAKGLQALGRTEIEVTPLTISLSAPEGASVGTTPEIAWEGPDYQGDFITVSTTDAEDGQYETYEYTREGSPLPLVMPSEPGTYELRYVLAASGTVAGRSAPFEVAAASVSVSGPTEAVAGSEIEVTWQGPDAQNDYISIARADDDDGYETYSYTRGTNPLKVETPIEPGDYEIRYVLNQNRTVLARQAITLTEVGAQVTAPATALAGTDVSVEWTGPGYASDFISFAEAGSDDGTYVTYTYTKEGSPLKIEAPTTPGSYEIRYIANADYTMLAAAPITVEAAEATLSAPDRAPAGAPLKVDWTGPETRNDYIAVAEPGSEAGDYVNYEYINRGNPLEIDLPATPGDYELQYVLTGRPVTIITRRPITVEEVTASLTGERRESSIAITWEGPGYRRDYVTIARPEDDPGTYEDYAYTNRGETVEVDVPETPGTYELRYILDGDVDRVLARVPFTVE